MRRTTGDSARILPLVESIYDAVTAVERWPGVLAEICDAVGGVASSLDTYDFTNRGGGASHVFGIDPERVRTYGDYYAAKNILIQRARPLLASGAVVVASDYLTPSEVDQSEYHNDFLGPMGLGDAAGACIFLERSTMTQLSVFRPVGGDDFGPRDASLLRGLVPHFQRAQSIHRRLAAVEQREAALDGALECLDRALVVLDERGHPLATNLAARLILEPGDSLVLSNQGLRARRPSDDQKLQRLIRSALDCRSRPELGGGGGLSVARSSSKAPIAALVLPGVRRDRPPAGALVFLTDPERQPLPPAELLCCCFGLSNAEAKLVFALAQEPSLPRAASRLGIGRETARTHLRSEFRKVGVSNQAELLALVARLPAPAVPA